jgi:hypothetical protein
VGLGKVRFGTSPAREESRARALKEHTMVPSMKPHTDPELVRRAVAHPPTIIVIQRLIKQLRSHLVKPGLEEALEAAAGVEGADPGLVCAFFAYSGDDNPLTEGVGV